VDLAIVERIVEAAEGTPLFVEEVIRVLVEDGRLRRDDGRWVVNGDLAHVEIPPTIDALLGARLDRLPERERDTLARAATIGRVFWWGAAAELASVDERSAVGRSLQGLVRRELILPEPSTMRGEDAFRFSNVLIRDVAYRSLGKELRSSLHQAVASWLDRRAPDRQAEFDELVGYHLEQAARYREQLGPLDDAGRVLRVQAGNRLASAGRRAAASGDVPAAIGLLDRALALLPPGTRLQLELLPVLGGALIAAGEMTRADAVLTEAAAGAAALPDPVLAAHARIERAFLRVLTHPAGETRGVESLVKECLAIFERAGDEIGLSRAWRLRSWSSWATTQYGAAARMLDRALDHARRAGDIREEGEIVAILGGCLCYGPTPVPEALARIRTMRAEARTAGAARVEAGTLAMLAYLEALLGNTSEARRLLAEDREILTERGLGYALAKRAEVRALVEMLAGDPVAAEAELRTGIGALERMGEVLRYSTMAADLAQALAAQGRHHEAEEFVAISEATATDDDLTSQVLWRSARATLRAHRGDLPAAIADIDTAVELALGSDDLRLHGATHLRRAAIRADGGNAAGAIEDARAAIAAFDAKGATVDVDRARVILADLDPTTAGRGGPVG